MGAATSGGGKITNKGGLETLAAISDENTLLLAVDNKRLSSFERLLQKGSPVTARVLKAIFDSWARQGPEFLEAWLQVGGNVNGVYDGSTPLK